MVPVARLHEWPIMDWGLIPNCSVKLSAERSLLADNPRVDEGMENLLNGRMPKRHTEVWMHGTRRSSCSTSDLYCEIPFPLAICTNYHNPSFNAASSTCSQPT